MKEPTTERDEEKAEPAAVEADNGGSTRAEKKVSFDLLEQQGPINQENAAPAAAKDEEEPQVWCV